MSWSEAIRPDVLDPRRASAADRLPVAHVVLEEFHVFTQPANGAVGRVPIDGCRSADVGLRQ